MQVPSKVALLGVSGGHSTGQAFEDDKDTGSA